MSLDSGASKPESSSVTYVCKLLLQHVLIHAQPHLESFSIRQASSAGIIAAPLRRMLCSRLTQFDLHSKNVARLSVSNECLRTSHAGTQPCHALSQHVDCSCRLQQLPRSRSKMQLAHSPPPRRTKTIRMPQRRMLAHQKHQPRAAPSSDLSKLQALHQAELLAAAPTAQMKAVRVKAKHPPVGPVVNKHAAVSIQTAGKLSQPSQP